MAAQHKHLVYIYYILAVLLVQSHCLQYENGKAYKYTYDTKVIFNDHLSKKASKPQQDVGLHMTLEFDLTPAYDSPEAQLMKLQVTSAALTSLHRSGMEGQLMDMLKFPAYFEYLEGGLVGRVYTVEKDSVFCSNVKKGLISVFQVQTEPGQREELDVMGDYQVTYTICGPTIVKQKTDCKILDVMGDCQATYTISGPTIVKQKTDCENLEIAGQHQNRNQIFGVSSSSSSTWTYQVENNIIHTMMGSNRHLATLNIKSSLNTMVMAVQKLTFLSFGPMKDSDKIPAEDFEDAATILKQGSNYPISEMLLPSAPEVQQCTPNTCKKPKDILLKQKDSLTSDKVGTIESAKAFLELLKAFRNSGKESISETMTHPDSSYIVPQLLDIAVATQTPAAQKSLMELLNFEENSNLVYPLRYLLGAAYSTHPGEYLLKDLLSLMKRKVPSQAVEEGLALALGSAIYSYCRDPEKCGDQIVKEYADLVLNQFSKCSTEACQLLYIRSMGNSGLNVFTQTIFDTITRKGGSSMLGFNAIQALRRIPAQYFSCKEIHSLNNIFHQADRNYDSSVRAMAAELLLTTNVSKTTVVNILQATASDQKQFELSTFILRKVIDLAKYDVNLRNILEEVYKDSRVNNYNIWAQRGKSSGFSSLLAETHEANATYGLFMEMARSGVLKKSSMDVSIVSGDAIQKLLGMARSGVLKKSSMDVSIVSGNAVQKLLGFGIYASGLESLLGEEPDPEAAEEEATAGLGLRILDVLLPPVEFFRGSGGLMSAVWNAPSDPVSALQTGFLLQDHSERFHLANGLVVELQVLGAASIDLTGMVSISLWNRNSESLIRNSGALVIEGSMKLDSAIGQAGAVFTAEGESFIDFETDVDFYESPFKMCMQMKRPKTIFKHTLEKYEKATKFDRRYKSRVAKKSFIEGVSYFLNEKNSDMCKAMKG